MSKPSIIQVIKSVLSAAAGIQSGDNRERDFTQGSFATYAIAGVIFTVLFVVGLIFLVSSIIG
ncbi:MAG: DUF2970 domain-containing protein [Methylococcales bacterium]|nr:DUF2970 domain-containing protein [Methylococcaceae bacterium]